MSLTGARRFEGAGLYASSSPEPPDSGASLSLSSPSDISSSSSSLSSFLFFFAEKISRYSKKNERRINLKRSLEI